MLYGVERQTPKVVRGSVPAFVCHVSVRGLMQRKRKEDDGHTEQKGNDNTADIAAGENIK